jgi:hypothetical protein
MQYHLGYTVILTDGDLLFSHIRKTEGELSAEPGIHEPGAEKNTPSPEGRTAPDCTGKVTGEFDPFQCW